MPKKTQFRVLQGCIFCGKRPLTDEHVYADWLNPYISIDYSHTTHTFSYQTYENGPYIEGHVVKNGNPTTKKINCVCKICNGGWMSTLQSDVKPILIEFLNGNWIKTTHAQQLTLAAWVTMFTMVSEYKHRETVAISQAERTRFYETHLPLPNFNIWACSFDPTAMNLVNSHRGLYILPKDQSVDGKTGFNTQITIFDIGRILFICFSTTARCLLQKPTLELEALRRFMRDMNTKRLFPISSQMNYSTQLEVNKLYIEDF